MCESDPAVTNARNGPTPAQVAADLAPSAGNANDQGRGRRFATADSHPREVAARRQ
jgi:hypothetical protein